MAAAMPRAASPPIVPPTAPAIGDLSSVDSDHKINYDIRRVKEVSSSINKPWRDTL